jgi:hypothetical protein
VTCHERDSRSEDITMNPTTLNRTVRELDCRTNDHIEVRLLWNSLTDSVSVSVHDTRYGESFQFDVAPAHALEAFRHPFAYAGNHDPRSRRPEHLPAGRPRRKDKR